ncbi:MAG: elongator complex protein 3, partial [Dehalococcoidia bacterium]
ALNGCQSASLKDAKDLNERGRPRCVAFCIETRPDLCMERDVQRLLDFGVTRVEIGVQTLDDEIHCLTGRGHGVEEVVTATRLLRHYGFKVDYHWMPGLPGSNPEHDLELSKVLFNDERFRPDGLKLYPALVLEGTELEKWYREGRYQPYSDAEMTDLLVDIKNTLPKYVRVHRLMRDIPGGYIVDGIRDMSIRGVLKKRMEERGLHCRCTRCREYGHRLRDGWRVGKPFLTRMDYDALGGKEVFLSYEDENETLFGLLRLRSNEPSSPDGSRKAFVRELHVFGTEVRLGERDDTAAQHKSLGEKLLREAERVAREEFGTEKLYILSGVGVRDYYRALGYDLEGDYMVKEL